jgi:ATP-dependent DNA helicase RecG
MLIPPDIIDRWISGNEDEHCEFKEAKSTFDKNTLTDYCIALANEGGGHLILGVTDSKPRVVIGSQAFYGTLEELKHQLLQRIHFRVDATEYYKDQKRIVIFHIPPRPIGTALQYQGRYLMRSGSSLTSMTAEKIKQILSEGQIDFSAEICPKTTIQDLDPNAIDILRKLWAKKSKDAEKLNKTDLEILRDTELITSEGEITYAALILLGTSAAFGKFLPNAEIIYEFRSNSASIQYQYRSEYRRGFLTYVDEIWNQINLRNEIRQVRHGLVVEEVKAFNEEVVREGYLNAVCHRDYRMGESIFIRQQPQKLEIESPGRFPPGITPDNILDRQNPRNRRVAETFQKIGHVERSGQGADRMFRIMIEEGKPRPDYNKSDEFRVLLRLCSEIKDPQFLTFLDKIGQETLKSWSVHDLILLDDIRQGKIRRADDRIRQFVEQGIVEHIGGSGKASRYILSKRFYSFIGEKGIYTRKKGLNRDTNKELLLAHLKNHNLGKIKEFEEVLPELTRSQIHSLLKELKRSGKIKHIGSKRMGYWERL